MVLTLKQNSREWGWNPRIPQTERATYHWVAFPIGTRVSQRELGRRKDESYEAHERVPARALARRPRASGRWMV